MKMRSRYRFLLGCLMIFSLGACGHKSIKEEPTPKTIYEQGMVQLKNGSYGLAAETFEKVEDAAPFTQTAQDALIMAAYSHYKAKQYIDSGRIIGYFSESYPMNPHLDYMSYLASLNYYAQISSSRRSRDNTEKAYLSLRSTVLRYPGTDYAQDSLRKLKTVETYLSGNDMAIGRFYLKRNNYIGAMNHFQTVLEDYSSSEYSAEAAYRLMEIKLTLRMVPEAKKYFEILESNYKNTKWYKHGQSLLEKYEDIYS